MSSYRLNTVLARDWHPVYGTNIGYQTSFSKGDVERGFAGADDIFDDIFRSQQVQHCSLEPACGGGRAEEFLCMGVSPHTAGARQAARLCHREGLTARKFEPEEMFYPTTLEN